jgi:hypothetical protein
LAEKKFGIADKMCTIIRTDDIANNPKLT